MNRLSTSLLGIAVSLGACAGLAGCAHPTSSAPGAGPPTVTVSYPLQREVTDYAEYTGRTAAVDRAAHRPPSSTAVTARPPGDGRPGDRGESGSR